MDELIKQVVQKAGVSEDQAKQAVETVLDFLKDKLPDYMVPGAYITLDVLPLTANGKVDRSALPAPDQSRPAPEETYVAPRSPVEEALAEIWTQVLGLDQVGINDNFFELGGHSLLATQVISRVTHSFQVTLSLRSLFGAPTIADLAVVITQTIAEQASEEDLHHHLAELEKLSDEEAK